MADWVVVARPSLVSEGEALCEMLQEEGIVAELVERGDPLVPLSRTSEVRVAPAVAEIAARLIGGWQGAADAEVPPSSAPEAPLHTGPPLPDDSSGPLRFLVLPVLGLLLVASLIANVWMYTRYSSDPFSPVWKSYDAAGVEIGESHYREGKSFPHYSVQRSRDRRLEHETFDDDADGRPERTRAILRTTSMGIASETNWYDADEDGLFERGTERLAGDERLEHWSDLDRDGIAERLEVVAGKEPLVRCEDLDRDQAFETCTSFVAGEPAARLHDADADGFFETSECLVPAPDCPLRRR